MNTDKILIQSWLHSLDDMQQDARGEVANEVNGAYSWLENVIRKESDPTKEEMSQCRYIMKNVQKSFYVQQWKRDDLKNQAKRFRLIFRQRMAKTLGILFIPSQFKPA